MSAHLWEMMANLEAAILTALHKHFHGTDRAPYTMRGHDDDTVNCGHCGEAAEVAIAAYEAEQTTPDLDDQRRENAQAALDRIQGHAESGEADELALDALARDYGIVSAALTWRERR